METLLKLLVAAFDNSLLRSFHELALKYGNYLTPIAKVLDVVGDLPLLLIGWLGFVLFWVLKDKKCGMYMCGSVIISAIIVTLVIKNLVFRPRPYVDSELYKTWWQMFNLKEHWDTSFPSGHTSAAMAGVMAFFIWSDHKGIAWLAFLYPLIMGASRIYLCVHYPSDVVVGLFTGMLSAFICYPIVALFYKLFRKYPKNPICRYFLTGKTK